MDPYLEDPVEWRGFHPLFITYAAEALNGALPPNYIARVDERLRVVQTNREILPDVVVFEQPVPASPSARTGGAIAVAAVEADTPHIITVEPVELREGFIEIVHVAQQREVVTVIELLSPTNKATGDEGQRRYQTKQNELLRSNQNLIEIDLLRRGEFTAAVPLEKLVLEGYWDYLASLHRGHQKGRFEVWTWHLRQQAPRIRVPLAQGDPDITLPLQAVLDRCYEAGRYASSIDYRKEPPLPPLRAADAEWADQLLREKGLRPAAGSQEEQPS
jgi:hypothetical protein